MQELILVFSACAFPIYVWSIINVLQEVPAWILRLTVWDLVGIIAYTQVIALIETALVFLVLVFLGVILPARLFRDRFVAQASMVVLLSSAWVIFSHYNNIVNPDRVRQLVFWVAVYLVLIGIFYVLIQRYKKLEEIIYSFANRLTVLSSVYIIVGFLSVIIVIVRNI